MEDLEGMDELDLTEVEREICRLPDVTIARLVAEPSGRVSEVHVVAHPASTRSRSPATSSRSRSPRSGSSSTAASSRSCSSAATCSTRRCSRRILRPSVVAITAEANGLRSLVRVTLARDDEEAVGFAEGSIATTARHRLVATATVDALRQLEPAAECIDVDNAADPARRRARHRRRDRRVRDAALGTARLGIGDRRARNKRPTRSRGPCSTRRTVASRTSAQSDAHPERSQRVTAGRCPIVDARGARSCCRLVPARRRRRRRGRGPQVGVGAR